MFTHSTHIRWALTVAAAAALQGVTPPAAAAQTDTLPSTSVGSGRLRFVMGHHWLDLTKLNERLTGAGLGSFDEGFGSIGGRLLGGGGRLLTGVEGHLLFGAAPPDGARTSPLAGALGQVDVGYLVHSSERFDLWPMLGLGCGIVGFDVRREGQPAFDDVVTDPGQGSRLESSGFLADMSLAMEYRFGKGKGLVVGLGVGYTHAMGGWDWRVNGAQDVTSGPEATVEGVHIDVSLGGWGRSQG